MVISFRSPLKWDLIRNNPKSGPVAAWLWRRIGAQNGIRRVLGLKELQGQRQFLSHYGFSTVFMGVVQLGK
jgi:hypothetical protein